MDPITPLHQETLNGERDTSETPHAQEPHKTYTPTNHVRNLDKELSSSDAVQVSPTTDQRPHPPPDHPILFITAALKPAILKKRHYLTEGICQTIPPPPGDKFGFR